MEWKVFRRTNELMSVNKELNTYIYKSATDLNTHIQRVRQSLEDLRGENLNENARKFTHKLASSVYQIDDISHNMYEIVDFKKLHPKIEQVDFQSIKTND